MDDSSPKRDLQIGAAIFLLALGVRIVYLCQSAGNPSFETPIVDSGTYDRMARNVVDGHGMNDDFFWQPFFYPTFLSGVYFFTDSSIISAKVVQLLLGSLTCVLTFKLGKTVFGLAVGMVAGIMTALYGPLVFFEAELLASGWAAFWSVVLVLLFIKASSARGIWLFLVLGVSGALSIVTRPTFAPFFIAGCAWLFVKSCRAKYSWTRIVLGASAILGGFLLVAIPVALQNKRLTGKFGILPASGGINLFIGNNPNSAETLTARPGWGWDELTSLPRDNGVEGDMWDHQKYFNERVVDYVLGDPVGFIRGLAYKTGQFLNSRELPRNVDVYVSGKWSRLLSLLVWKAGKFGFPFGLLLPLAMVGLIGAWPRISTPIKLFLLFYPLSVILVFVTARYRVPVMPVLSVVAAAGAVTLIRLIRGLLWGRILAALALITAVVLLSTLPGPFPEEQPNFEAELYANVAATDAHRGNHDAAMENLQKAISLQPDYPSAHAYFGAGLYQSGLTDRAIEHFELALQYKPDSPEVLVNLGNALVEKGRVDEGIALLNKALHGSPRYARVHFNVGNVYLGLGEPDKAVEHYRKAVQIKPDYTKAHGNLAVALALLGKLEQAIVHFTEAVRLQPDNVDARHNLAKALADQGRTKEAVRECRRILRANPQNVATLGLLARMLVEGKDPQLTDPAEAILLAERACRLTTHQYPQLLSTLAQAYAAAERWSEAADTVRKAVDLSSAAGRKQLTDFLRGQLRHYEDKLAENEESPSTNQGNP